VRGFEHRDVVPQLRELIGGDQPEQAGSDDEDFSPPDGARRVRFAPAGLREGGGL
jgi:hypothetical protein